VLFREPLKPTLPALDQPRILPCMSVMETRVLLKVARMLAIPVLIFLAPLALTIFLAAASSPSNSAAVGAVPAVGSAGLAGSGAASPGAAFFAGALAGRASPAAFADAAGAWPAGAAASGAGEAGASGLASFLGAVFFGFASSAIQNRELNVNR